MNFLKNFIKKTHKASFIIDDNNYCCLVGQRCDYYIFICKNGLGYWGPWMKGREWTAFWDECICLNNSPHLMEKLENQFNKFKLKTGKFIK